MEAFVSAQTPASLNAVFKHVDGSLSAKNKIEIIESLLMASAFSPRPSDLLVEKILVRTVASRTQQLSSSRSLGTDEQMGGDRSSIGAEHLSILGRGRSSIVRNQQEVTGEFDCRFLPYK